MTRDRPTEIPELRFVGTTWYDRGWRYWWLRIWLSIFWLLVTALFVAVIGIFISAILSLVSGMAGRILVVVLCAMPIIGSCLSAYVQLRRTPEERAANFPVSFRDREDTSGVPIAGAAGAGAAAVGASLASFILALSTLFVVGYMVGFLRTTLGRYVSVEEWNAARTYGLEPEPPDPSEDFRSAHPLRLRSWFD